MKKLSYLFLVFVLSFTLFSVAFAGTLGPAPFNGGGQLLPGWSNMGGGWYYSGSYYSNDSGSIQAYTSNEFGSLMNASVVISLPPLITDPSSGCTGYESSPSCRPEWAEALSNCVANSFNAGTSTCTPSNTNTFKASPVVAVCSATNTTGPCRPERVNPYAAANIAKQAQAIGQQKGYNISCSASRANFGGVGTDATTNLPYYMNSLCTVNSLSGVSAEQLVTNPNAWTTLKNEIAGQTGGTTTGTGTGTTGGQTTPNTTGGTNATGPVTNATATQIKSSMVAYIKDLISQYTKQLDVVKTQLAQTSTTGSSSNTNTTTTTGQDPQVVISFADGLKTKNVSVGDTLIYKITMSNIDSLDSFYNTIPGDSCVGGSTGEQKPWIAKAIAPISVFSDDVKSCQSGATYVITVVGTNKSSNKISASSVSVVVK